MSKDEELFQQIRQGDLSAFDALYERYRLRLFRFIYSYLKNEQEAEDIFHEAFMKVLKSNDLDFSAGTFQAWIFEVSRNLSLNHIRSKVRSEKMVEAVPVPHVATSAEAILDRHQLEYKIKGAIQKLSEPQTEVLNLKLLGVTEKEISNTLRIPMGTVKSRFHALVEFIKQEIKE